MTRVTRLAPAKINLALHVVGKRADGYHLLDSLVAFADWGDEVTVAAADRLSLSVSGPFARGVPTGPENLMWRAADLMVRPDEPDPMAMHLVKRLPHAAGIGGGSSDAAAVLKALADLWAVDLPAPDQVLALGADVPVCIVGQVARMQGIGERISDVPALPPVWALLVNPGIAVPTGAVFARLQTPNRGPMPDIPQSWGTAARLVGWLEQTRNDLQDPACAACPAIAPVLSALAAAPGCRLARMSGSGATCFGLFETQSAADKAGRQLAALQPRWWIRPVRLS